MNTIQTPHSRNTVQNSHSKQHDLGTLCPSSSASAVSTQSGPVSAELSNRLIPLCDGRPGLRTALPIEALPTPANGDSPSGTPLPVIDFISSSASLDRYDEVICPEGWRLENYRRNPVFQNAHQYGDILFTLGKALITEIRNLPTPHLFQRIEFAVDVNPFARIAYGLYKSKFLNAVSVGFIPIRWENGGVEAGYQRKYVEQELLEVSAVGIPANPEALQLGLQAGAVAKADLQTLLEFILEKTGRRAQTSAESTQSPVPSSIQHLPSSSFPAAATNTNACAPGVRRNGAQLLELARALRDILRRS